MTNEVTQKSWVKNTKKRYYFIVHDLRSSDFDYTPLYNAIKKADAWWHNMETLWIIETELELDDWFKALEKHIPSADYLIIMDVSDFNARFPLESWPWLRERLDIQMKLDIKVKEGG